MVDAPLPPPALRHRVGGVDDYEQVGSAVRTDLLELLPPDWSFEGKRVLDFGCGAGRVLRHFLGEAQTAEFHGCDIDTESIDWLTAHLCPPLHVFRNGERPPLPRPDAYFDLIWSASVFTHITDAWSAWLLELHRVLKDGGLLIATFLGPGMSDSLASEEWEADRIGMNVLRYGQRWDQGGPLVFLSPWWIAEHWGRAFEILDLREAGFGRPDDRNAMQGVVLLRRKATRPTEEELERIDPQEEREIAALRHNIRQLHAESQMWHDRWQSSLQGQEDGGEQRAELEALRSALRALKTSRSWRITRPLRQAVGVARRLRSRSRPTLSQRRVPSPDGGDSRPSTSVPPPDLTPPPNPTLPRTHANAELSPELARELEREPGWMYPWSFARGAEAPLLHPELPSVHRTRAEMIERAARAALADAGPNATALDLACSEGYFAQRLLEWGAQRVVGIDIRAQNVRRAELVRDHFGIDPTDLSFQRSDVLELDPEILGRFDVVFLLGLIYHVEDPVGVVRLARRVTRSLCVIESQLTRQHAPVVHGQGVPDILFSADASFAAVLEEDSAHNPAASTPGVLSLIPNRAALELMVRAAGFESVQIVEAASHHNPQYRVGDRALALARQQRTDPGSGVVQE
jgi:2-polyprenyl-3-methyl-5-hydroxy-6-metoxy-1,4-benzoquinol methylase